MSMCSHPVPFSEERSCLFFRQLMLAVEFLHYRHIIHRDIKPENILFFTADIIKLADFGVAHIFDQEDQLTRTAGIDSRVHTWWLYTCLMSFPLAPRDAGLLCA